MSDEQKKKTVDQKSVWFKVGKVTGIVAGTVAALAGAFMVGRKTV